MKWIAGLLMALVLTMPFAVADEGTADAKADAQAVSTLDLRLKQAGQGFSDFVFHVRAFLTFDEKAKVEMLKERNAELRARQDAWLETKASLLGNSRNLTAEEKQEIMAAIQAEHEAIIENHLKATEKIREIQLKAKARGDAELESSAEAAAESDARLFAGLNGADSMLKLKLRARGEGKANVTAEQAQQMVEKRFGFEETTVTTVTEDGRTVFVVTGNETVAEGRFVMTKQITVKIDAETGTVISADFTAHFETVATGNVSSSAGAESEAEAEVASEIESSTSAQVGAGVGTSGSVQSGGGTSGSAGANAGAGASTGASSGNAGASGAGSVGVTIG